MCKMKGKLAGLYKKELSVFFSMPVAYAVLAVFMVLSGYFFASIVNQYAEFSLRSMSSQQRQMIDMNMIEWIFRPYFHNILVILVFMMPLVTMRLFAEEKREGTSELLFTYPVKDFTVVMSKFLSAMTVYALMLVSSAACFIMLGFITKYELLPVLAGMLGLFLAGGAFIMLGIFISSLTESQIVSGVITLGALLLSLVMPWIAQAAGPSWQKIIMALSVQQQFDSFAKGVLDTANLAFFINIMVLFFFLTLRSLETKKWRG
ncbi:MAG TPA: ABC transporter permease [bacterium]|nr:ABC transporter permease [bacterium]